MIWPGSTVMVTGCGGQPGCKHLCRHCPVVAEPAPQLVTRRDILEPGIDARTLALKTARQASTRTR